MMKHNLNGHHRLFQTLYLVAKMAETEQRGGYRTVILCQISIKNFAMIYTFKLHVCDFIWSVVKFKSQY